MPSGGCHKRRRKHQDINRGINRNLKQTLCSNKLTAFASICTNHPRQNSRRSACPIYLSFFLFVILNMLSIVKPWLVYKTPRIARGSISRVQISGVLTRLMRADGRGAVSTDIAQGASPSSSGSIGGHDRSGERSTVKSLRSYNMGPNGDIYRSVTAASRGSKDRAVVESSVDKRRSGVYADGNRQSKRAINGSEKDKTKSDKPLVPKTGRDADIHRAAESLTAHMKLKAPNTNSWTNKASQVATDRKEAANNRFSKIPSLSEPGRQLSAPNSRTPPPPITIVKNRPFTLPTGMFRPKQSLGQNFLSDQNYVNKIVDAFSDESPNGCRVVELGCGPGALTRLLYKRYPQMTGFEIDQRAIEFLSAKLPGINLVHKDVLQIDWAQLALSKNGPLSVIGNLPYYITSQILFSLLDNYRSIDKAVFTSQLEVAERIVAAPRTKAYGILSVAFQLYASNTATSTYGSSSSSTYSSSTFSSSSSSQNSPSMNAARRAEMLRFVIPSSVFFPRPKVDSALVHLDFTRPHKDLHRVPLLQLRRILLTAFQQRRKMLRQSLKDMLFKEGIELPEKYSTKRPEELCPEEFLELTADLFGEVSLDAISDHSSPSSRARRSVAVIDIPSNSDQAPDSSSGSSSSIPTEPTVRSYDPLVVWRRRMVPYEVNSTSSPGFDSTLGDGLGGRKQLLGKQA